MAQSLAAADGVYITEIARKDQLDPLTRLDPAKIVTDIKAAGKEAHFLADGDAILKDLLPRLKAGDVIGVFTNGSFGGLVPKLAETLKNL